MFIDIDYKRKLKEAKLQLAKPNKQIITPILNKFDTELIIKLGSINELRFSIPHATYDMGGLKTNPQIDMIKERMLIKVTMGTYIDWFVVDQIEEDGNDTDIFNVTCFSLGHELIGKRISELEETAIDAKTLLIKILEPTNGLWTVGEVDNLFQVMARDFDSGTDSNSLECITNAAETYGALVVWDNINRTVSFKDLSQNGVFRGMTVNYGRLLQSIKRTRTTEEMVTRLHVYGAENMSIYTVNPTGQSYIEDFSFFMYPFERDANRNVLKQSHYMSDELCHAILDHKILLENNSTPIRDLNTQRATKTTEFVTEESALIELENELENILSLLDIAKAAGDTAAINTGNANRSAKLSEINAQQTVVNNLRSEIISIDNQLTVLQDNITNQANFTPELIKELNIYVHTDTWRDDRYIDEKELYEDALKRFAELRKPKIVIETTIENILTVVEEQYYWDKLILGDLIKVKYPQMNIEYTAKIIEISYNLEAGEVNLTIANTTDLLNENEKFVQTLNKNISASQLIANNKYKWDKINAVSQTVSSMLTQEWDATKQKIIAGVNNTVEIGKRGIIIRNENPMEIVIMQAGVIALSKDGGETWKTAVKPDGVVAERLIGKIIAGQELLITNSSGTFTMDNNGAIFDVDAFMIRSASGNNLVEEWIEGKDFIDSYRDDNIITAFEKKMLKIEWGKILARYNANIAVLNSFYENGGVGQAFVDDYKNRYTQLYNYLFVNLHGGTLPMLADANMANSTRVDSAVFNTTFRNYEATEVEVERQLALKGKTFSDAASALAQEALDNAQSIDFHDIQLESSSGIIFKNGLINTTISAKVFRNGSDITNTVAASGFTWKRYDKNNVLDSAWTKTGVKSVTATSSDVNERATIECEVDIP